MNTNVDRLSDALELHKKGNLVQARQIYQQILDSDPDNADANYLLGTLFCQTNNFSDAEQLILQAIRLAPDRAAYLINLGYIYENTKRYDKAKTAYVNALSLHPDNPDAHFNLANVYFRTGDYPQAIDHYNAAIQSAPNNFLAYFKMGNAYLKQLSDDEAINAYKNCLRINDKYIDAWINLTELYEKSNLHEEAEQCIEQILLLDRNNSYARIHQAKVLKRNNKISEALEILEELLTSQNEIDIAIALHFELGDTYHRLERFDQAYRHYSEGNRLKSLTEEAAQFDKHRFLELVRQYRTNYQNRETHLPHLYHQPLPCQPVFLFGFPRSGNTLLGQILDSHPQILTLVEKLLFNSLVREVENNYPDHSDPFEILSDKELERLRGEYFEGAAKFRSDSHTPVLIDSHPFTTIYIDKIRAVLPEAKFILLLRHPYDVCLSNFMQNFALNDAMANFFTLRDAAVLYNETMLLWRLFEKEVSPDLYLIKYENIVDNFEPEISKVLDFMNLPWDPKVTEFHTNILQKKKRITTQSYDQVVKPIYKEARDRWKSYEEYLTQVIPILKPHAQYFGYM